MRERVVVVTLLLACAVGCAESNPAEGQEIADGEAILAALEHVAEIKWSQRTTPLVGGKAAIAYDGEEPLSESARGFLDQAIAARGWRWSTEDPLVPTGNCVFPGGDCLLKDPTELHLTFSVTPWPGEEDYRGEDPDLLQWDRFVVEPVAGQEATRSTSRGWAASGGAESTKPNWAARDYWSRGGTTGWWSRA